MKSTLLSSARREIAQWRLHFRARRNGDGDSRPPRAAGAGETTFDPTEWSDTEWSDTEAEALALSAPTDLKTETPR
jgi:hypothetical protein